MRRRQFRVVDDRFVAFYGYESKNVQHRPDTEADYDVSNKQENAIKIGPRTMFRSAVNANSGQPKPGLLTMPHLSLRRRSAERPMAMFAIAVGVCFLSMALGPNLGSALANRDEPLNAGEGVNTSEGTMRQEFSEAEIACRGQAWGSESDQCLIEIAKDSGLSERRVRRLAAAAPNASTPNVF
jgi:hypothetical protein